MQDTMIFLSELVQIYLLSQIFHFLIALLTNITKEESLMNKKIRLTQLTKEEMNDAAAGAVSQPVQCTCRCYCTCYYDWDGVHDADFDAMCTASAGNFAQSYLPPVIIGNPTR